MDRAEIERLRELARKATNGPWIASQPSMAAFTVRLAGCEWTSPPGSAQVRADSSKIPTGCLIPYGIIWHEDAKYIAACSPEAIVALCDLALAQLAAQEGAAQDQSTKDAGGEIAARQCVQANPTAPLAEDGAGSSPPGRCESGPASAVVPSKEDRLSGNAETLCLHDGQDCEDGTCCQCGDPYESRNEGADDSPFLCDPCAQAVARVQFARANAAERERDEAIADAARYRWLRDSDSIAFDECVQEATGVWPHSLEEADAAIDAAIRGESGRKE